MLLAVNVFLLRTAPRQQRADRKQPDGQGGDVGPVRAATFIKASFQRLTRFFRASADL